MAEIVTEGSGWVEQLGDRAEFEVSLVAVAGTRSAAVAALGARVATVEPVLGRPDVVVRQRHLRVHDEWRGDRVVGCRAQEDVTLLLTEVAALDAVLPAIVAAEPAAVHGPRWVLADPTEARREAQRRAVVDARDRAEGYAAALGGTLGELQRLSEAPTYEAHSTSAWGEREQRGDPDVRELSLAPQPVRVNVRCTTEWSFRTP